jgi:hypothetical protein
MVFSQTAPLSRQTDFQRCAAIAEFLAAEEGGLVGRQAGGDDDQITTMNSRGAVSLILQIERAPDR